MTPAGKKGIPIFLKIRYNPIPINDICSPEIANICPIPLF